MASPDWRPLIGLTEHFLMRFVIVTGLAAGNLAWFLRSWSDTAFIGLIFLGDILTSSSNAGYKHVGEMSIEDRMRALVRVLIVLVAVIDRTAGPAATNPAYLSVLGIALTFLGITLQRRAAFAFRAVETPMFVTAKPTTLVQTGIFGYMRHPGYVGLVLVTIGAVLLLRSVVAAAIALVVYCIWLGLRIRREEAVLKEVFGEEYDAWAARTRRFIPIRRSVRGQKTAAPAPVEPSAADGLNEVTGESR